MRFCNFDYPKYFMISVFLLLFPFSFSRMVEMTWARVLTVLADSEISVDSRSVKKSLQSAVPFWDSFFVLYCMLELTYLFVYLFIVFVWLFFFYCIMLTISWYASISISLIYLFWMCMLSFYSYVWYLILLLINWFFNNLIIHIFMIFTHYFLF